MSQSNPARVSLSRSVAMGAIAAFVLSGCADQDLVGPAARSDAVAPSAAAAAQDRGPLERVQFIHFRRGFQKPPWAGGGNGGNDTSSCFAFIARGAAWNSAEPWEVFNGTTDVTQADLWDKVDTALDDWEAAAGWDIAGDGVTNGATDVDLNSVDGHNVVKFGSVSQAGAIAVTNVWGYFSGPPPTREIVEWDMILDDVDYDWSLTGEENKMDVHNIVEHEIGHALGMGHPELTCTEETMYAYADYGETKKQTLNSGDEAGIADLY
jgi:hypothetical protein